VKVLSDAGNESREVLEIRRALFQLGDSRPKPAGHVGGVVYERLMKHDRHSWGSD
jgi:hypothetical protein